MSDAVAASDEAHTTPLEADKAAAAADADVVAAFSSSSSSSSPRPALADADAAATAAAATEQPLRPSPAVHAPPYVLDPEVLRNLIINYLPPLMDERQLHQLFVQFGPIESVKIIYDKATRESRGYGFVKYVHFFSATYAIACLNRFHIAGKKLKVAYANIDGAKDAYEQVRHTATMFTPQQQLAYSVMYQAQTSYTPE